MRRVVLIASVLVAQGCQTAPSRAPIPALAEDSGPLPYAELVTRARRQAMTALEAYYIDRWAEVEESARGLEQTARFLRKSTDVPATRQGDLSLRADTLADAAKQLRDAAKTRASEQVNSVLQRINSQVRELR
jgi:hypothetical protein